MIFSLHLAAEYKTHYPGFRSLLQPILRLNFTAVMDQSRPSLLGGLHYTFHQMKSRLSSFREFIVNKAIICIFKVHVILDFSSLSCPVIISEQIFKGINENIYY